MIIFRIISDIDASIIFNNLYTIDEKEQVLLKSRGIDWTNRKDFRLLLALFSICLLYVQSLMKIT